MRELVCTGCREVVGVIEIPEDYIDPELFVCGQCLTPVAQQELALDGHRVETRPYDPAIADIGY